MTDVRPARVKPYAPPPDNGLTIAYLDQDLLAVDKPSGLLAVPGRTAQLQDCLAARVCQRFAHAQVVHRLDEATSGLMLFALNAGTQRALGLAFEQRQIDKTYIAVVHGIVVNDSGVIEAPLAADWPRRPLQRIDLANGKPAITHWQVLGRDHQNASTRMLLRPHTGRTHQLRVHMLALGHPICGDLLYAGHASGTQSFNRLMLHAHSLQLVHPVHQTRLHIETASPF